MGLLLRMDLQGLELLPCRNTNKLLILFSMEMIVLGDCLIHKALQ